MHWIPREHFNPLTPTSQIKFTIYHMSPLPLPSPLSPSTALPKNAEWLSSNIFCRATQTLLLRIWFNPRCVLNFFPCFDVGQQNLGLFFPLGGSLTPAGKGSVDSRGFSRFNVSSTGIRGCMFKLGKTLGDWWISYQHSTVQYNSN